MGSFETLVVGEKDCTFKDVVDVFFYDVNSIAVFRSWTDFAREIDIKPYLIEEWIRDILMKILTVKDVLYNILTSWKSEKGKDATLQNLLKHLEKVELKNVADDLRKHFSKKNRVHTGGGLFKTTLHNKPIYYIPRTLITRRVIDSIVFSSTHKDVFVVDGDGIDRYRLSQLAKKELTDTSSNQVRKDELSVRFILLELFGDWALLCCKTTNPIHLLKHHEGRFHWICTKGDISALQKASDERSQNAFSEEEFIDEIETDIQFQINQPLCISDSPGMGKSLLLANIGRKLQQRYTERCIAFIVISEFVVKIRELLSKFGKTEKAIQEALLQMCENSTTREHLVQKMRTPTENPSTQIELMFDGFDEVSTDNFEVAYECLDTLKTNFNSGIRVWVTTRPQHLHDLEMRFSVLGYKIQGFQEKHQIDFLTSFWNSQSQGTKLDEDKLQRFSETCLSTIKKKLNRRDEDIAGIPLQCMMLAEVYMQDAHRFSDLKNRSCKHCPETVNFINVNSIADLYEKMIAHKIGKFIKTYPLVPENINSILPWHMYLALKLIFPSHSRKFKDTLQIESELEPDYLVNIGILERGGNPTNDRARFIHRTFAEYLAARFFVLYEIETSTADLQNFTMRLPNFLFKHVLEISITWTYSFKHSVLCHFLNVLLGSRTYLSMEHSISQESTNCIKNVMIVCIHSDFGNIIKLLHSLKYPESFSIKDILYSSDSKIFIDAVTMTSFDLLKFLLQSFEHKPLNAIKKSFLVLRTPLHAAVRRGSYTIFEYILKEHHLEDFVKKEETFLDLVYDAVRGTVDGVLDEIHDRVQIVTALCDLSRKMLNYCNTEEETPLLLPRVNVKLLKILIECGANLFHFDKRKNTILHKATEYLSPTDYYDLLQFIPKNTLSSLLRLFNKDGDHTLHLIVKHGLATPNILRLILSNGVDMNTSNKRGNTCISSTLEIKNEDMTIPTVKLLIENGADHTRVDILGSSIVHYSAKRGRIDCLQFFLEEKIVNVNQINEEGDTPIFHSLRNFNTALETVHFLLERGADYKILNGNRSNVLHYAASNGQLECMQLFISLGGLDINLANDDGDTPLLCALRFYRESKIEMIRLLLGKGADHTTSDRKGNNVLHLAADIRYAECFSQFKPEYRILDQDRSIPLRHSARIGNFECFNEFVGLPSIDVNARNCDNNTPLHLVIKNIYNDYYHLDDFNSLVYTIEALRSLGADVSAKNNDDETPLDIYQRKEWTMFGFKREELMKKDLKIRRLLESSGRKNHWNRCTVQ